jgi:hypothetical protein
MGISINKIGGGSTPVVAPYKVFTALLTQTGFYDPQTSTEGGTLNAGYSYLITANSGYDFISLGAPSNDVGTYFICNQNIKTDSGSAFEVSFNNGAPICIVLENTLGNVWFEYGDSDITGQYKFFSNDLFEYNKTYLSSFVLTLQYFLSVQYTNSNTLTLTNGNLGDRRNSLLNNTPFEIKVYN